MVLGGPRSLAAGARVQYMGVWTPHGADSVQQEFFTLFSDTTSPMVFDGRYRRRASPTWPADKGPSGCADRAGNHEMDFTLGSWDVYVNDADAVAQTPPGARRPPPHGRSEIAADLGGCLLIERYAATRTPAGHEAVAYTAYNPSAQKWERTHADTRGLRVFLGGGALESGRMVMLGHVPRLDTHRDSLRVTWEPVSAREFRQLWETSPDGKTWGMAMRVVYVKR